MRRTLSAVLVLLCGCTVYTPVATNTGLDGQPVRLVLNQSGVRALEPALGAATSEVEGRVQETTDSSVVLLVSGVTRNSGTAEPWNGERAEVPLRDIASVATRRTSFARSALLAGVIGGGVFLVGRSFGGGNATGSHTTYGGPAQ